MASVGRGFASPSRVGAQEIQTAYSGQFYGNLLVSPRQFYSVEVQMGNRSTEKPTAEASAVVFSPAQAEKRLQQWRNVIIDSFGLKLPGKADIDALVKAGLPASRVAKKLRQAKNAAKAMKEIDDRRSAGWPLSNVVPRTRDGAVPLWHLEAPSETWTVLIDETGERFDDDEKGAPGRFAVLVVPNGCELPIFEDFHASESTPTQIDEVLQALLDRPIGVFGLDVGASEARSLETDVWIQGILESVHWVLRLLPVGHGPTRVSFFVEQKGKHFQARGNLETALAEIRRSLARHHPARAKHIEISGFQFVNKSDTRLAFVDAMAHSFAERRPDAAARLKLSGLKGALLTARSVTIRDYDRVEGSNELDGEVWRRLLQQGDALHALGLRLLQRLAERCRSDVEAWQTLVEMTGASLDDAKRNLNHVGREVSWLAACRPQGARFTPNVELVWATVELAEANHRGQVSLDTVRRIRHLGDSLLDEEVRLVAEAELHAAVTLTNLFDFRAAAEIMGRWGGDHRRELGRRLFGRVLSTRGQHEAFVGHNAQAIGFFNRAIAEFESMLNLDSARRELAQTRSYRGFALVDLNLERGLTVEEGLWLKDDIRDLAGPAHRLLAEGPTRFALDGPGPTAYQWHFFFRTIADLKGVGAKGDVSRLPPPCEPDVWQWPWPIVQAYCASRLWLHGEHDKARERLKHALELARMPAQGPTVRAIALAIEMAAVPWGQTVDEAVKDAVEREVPLAGARFRSVTLGDDFVANLRALLPFNFR